MSKKKTNPARIPKTQADVDRAYQQGLLAGCQTTAAIFLLTLLDKEHADKEILQRVWREVCDLSDDVTRGAVKLHEVKDTLKKEYEINIT